MPSKPLKCSQPQPAKRRPEAFACNSRSQLYAGATLADSSFSKVNAIHGSRHLVTARPARQHISSNLALSSFLAHQLWACKRVAAKIFDPDASAGKSTGAPAIRKHPTEAMTTPKRSLTEPEHVDLQDSYYETSLWTNKKEDLELDTYFHPLRPNLGQDYGIPGLRPVIKNIKQNDYLLMDDNKRFYTWNPDDGRLWRMVQQGLEPGQAADRAMNGLVQGKDVQLVVHAPYKK